MRVLIFVFVYIEVVLCLYEDQINKFDWKKEFVGKITDVCFDISNSISKNLYVITEENVVASLSAKNGQINWRQVTNERNEKIMKYQEGILTISSDGIVRVWDYGTGLLKWDLGITPQDDNGFKFIDAAVVEISYSEGVRIAVLSSTTLYVIQSRPGAKQIIKSVNLKVELQENTRLYVSSQSKQIFLISLHENSHLSLSVFDVKTLNMDHEDAIHSWLDDIDNIALLENSKLVYAAKDTSSLYVVDLAAGKEIVSEPLSNFDIADTVKIISLYGTKVNDGSDPGQDFFLTLDDNRLIHFNYNDEENAFQVIATISTPSSSKILLKSVGSERYHFVASQEENTLKIRSFNTKSGKEDVKLAIYYRLPAHVGHIENVFINFYLKRSDPIGYRALVTTSDDSLLMISQPTRMAWSRDESLSNVVAVEMMDLPLSDIEANIELEFEESEKRSILQMFFIRISAQIGQLKSFAKKITKDIKEGTLLERKTKDPLIRDESLTRDPFSLHKMLVVVTRIGKLFGIDSLSGEIIWSLNAAATTKQNLKLYIQRTTAHFPNPPQAILLSTSQEDDTFSLLVFNPITGDIIEHDVKSNTKGGVVQAMLLPFADSHHLRALLMLDHENNIHLMPDSEEMRNKLDSGEHSLYLYSADKNSGNLQGYRQINHKKVQKTWLVKIPGDQVITTVQGKVPFEKIDSMGRPLADRSVIYKYLNPNLVAMITQSKESDLDQAVNLYLIDVVSGHLVHTARHKKSSGPVNIVHTENWLIYTFWNTKNRRTEICSIELYEGKTLHNDTVFSSFHTRPNEPLVIQQSYIIAASINAMGVSRTERGLTSRQIIFGLKRGSLLGLPRRFFDPRRPLHAEQSHREEGLIPYGPEIPLSYEFFLSYNKTIQGMKGEFFVA